MENYEPRTRRRRCPRAPHHVAARVHSWPRHHMVWAPRSPSPTRFHPIPSFRYETFCYITPRTPRGPYIVFLSCFRFELFLSGSVLSFRSTMVSHNNNKVKEPMEGDLQDPKLEEEVKSEDGEEVEGNPRSCPRATVASIRVVPSRPNLRRNAFMSTGVKVPRHILAPRTPSSGIKNHVRTLIHDYQYQKVPHRDLPSGWDMDRNNNAGKFEGKEWGDSSKSWDSQSDRFMNRIEQNTELIRILTYKIDELKELVERLIKDSSPPSKK